MDEPVPGSGIAIEALVHLASCPDCKAPILVRNGRLIGYVEFQRDDTNRPGTATPHLKECPRLSEVEHDG